MEAPCQKMGMFKTDEIDAARVEWDYWVNGVVKLSVAFVGLLANTLGICTLFKTKERFLFVNLMLSLFFIDSIVLVTTMLSQLHIGYSSFISYLYPYVTYPIHQISLYASVWMTVIMSHERYQALKDPIAYRHRLARPRFQTHRLCKYLSVVIILSFILNIVKFLQYEIAYLEWPHLRNYYDGGFDEPKKILNYCDFACGTNPCTNMTYLCTNPVFPYLRKSKLLANNTFFINIVSWCDLLFRGVIPVILLIFFNLSVYQIIKKENLVIHKTLDTSDDHKVKHQETKMARTLLAIVIAFIFCYMPWYVPTIIYSLEKFDSICPDVPTTTISPICCCQYTLWYFLFEYLGNVLITLNSSINVLLYGFTAEKFRNEAKSMIMNAFNYLKCPCIEHIEKHISYNTGKSQRRPSFQAYSNTIGTEMTVVSTDPTNTAHQT
jgi:hypothetical protein